MSTVVPAGVVSHAPRLARLLIDRPRLIARLQERPALTLLRAPVGFGKTTVVAQWIAHHESGGDPREAVAWLRVRAGAGDATEFWTDVLQVLADAGLGVPPWAGETIPTRLAHLAERALLGADRPVLLVIDGFEHVTDHTLDAAVMDLLRHVHGLRLLVCLRSQRHFRPQYLDLDCLELTSRDLRFTLQETQQLVELTEGALPLGQVEQLHQALTGWPEPTRAAALQLREQTDPSAVPEVIDAVAADYLRNRLLSESDRPARLDLALRTALLDEFSPDIAHVLADDPDAKADIESLIDDGFVISTMRNGEQVLSWPAAARRVMRAELAKLRPDLVPQLHARAARWHLERGSVSSALRHALASRDWPVVIEVIEVAWRTLLHDPAELTDVFMALPMEAMARSPRVLALRDLTMRLPDDLLLNVAMLPADEAELASLGYRDDAAETLETCLALLVALRRRGAFGSARTYGLRALAIARAARTRHTGDVLGVSAMLHLQVSVAQLLADDVPGAVLSLRDAFDRGSHHPMGYVEHDAAGKLALAHTMFGDAREAATWLRVHQDTPTVDDSWVTPLVASTGLAADLLQALDALDLERAGRAHEAMVEHVGRDEFWAFMLYARSRYAVHTGAAGDILHAITRARHLYGHRLVEPGISRPLLAAAEADLLLTLGRGNLAAAVMRGPDAEHPVLRVGQARLALLSGQVDRALFLSDDTTWERSASHRDRLTMTIIHAITAERTGDHARAVATLQRAVDSATTGATWRPFLTVPRPELERLLAETPGSEALLAGPYAEHRSLFPDTVSLVALTDREQQVLEDLARGLTVAQIAEAAVLSYNTVRSQQRTLYKKLGTSDRKEVILRARRWGLLSADD